MIDLKFKDELLNVGIDIDDYNGFHHIASAITMNIFGAPDLKNDIEFYNKIREDLVKIIKKYGTIDIEHFPTYAQNIVRCKEENQQKLIDEIHAYIIMRKLGG